MLKKFIVITGLVAISGLMSVKAMAAQIYVVNNTDDYLMVRYRVETLFSADEPIFVVRPNSSHNEDKFIYWTSRILGTVYVTSDGGYDSGCDLESETGKNYYKVKVTVKSYTYSYYDAKRRLHEGKIMECISDFHN